MGAVFPSFGAASARRGRDEWNGRLALKKGVLTRTNWDRATVGRGAVSCEISALCFNGAAGPLAATLPVHIPLPIVLLATLTRAALPPRTASNAPNAVRNMVAEVLFELSWQNVKSSYSPSTPKLARRRRREDSPYFESATCEAAELRRQSRRKGVRSARFGYQVCFLIASKN